MKTVQQGKLYTSVSFPEANPHYFKEKHLAAWSGSQHRRNKQTNSVEDGKPLVPWLTPSPPCFFLYPVLRKAGGSHLKTLKIHFISGANCEINCSLLTHLQSPKWKRSFCCRVFATDSSYQCSDLQQLWLCQCPVNLVTSLGKHLRR